MYEIVYLFIDMNCFFQELNSALYTICLIPVWNDRYDMNRSTTLFNQYLLKTRATEVQFLNCCYFSYKSSQTAHQECSLFQKTTYVQSASTLTVLHTYLSLKRYERCFKIFYKREN